jgi:hypothetical protein
LPTITWPGIGVLGRVSLGPSKPGIESGFENRNQTACGSVYITGIHIALSGVFINKGARPLTSKGISW